MLLETANTVRKSYGLSVNVKFKCFYLQFCFIFHRRLKLFGENGDDVVIEVPCGVTAYKEEDNLFLGEVNQENDRVVILKGGKGASPANKFEAEQGERAIVYFDLKLIADVALIG